VMRTTRRRLLAGTSALAASAALGARLTPAAAQDAVTIRWWHISIEEDLKAGMQAAADAYMAEHPGVNIEITVLENDAFKTKMTTTMQSGDPPDVFQSWGGGVLYQYADAGLVRDITADLAQDGWGESFAQAGLNLYANNGQNWGVPWRMGMVGMWYYTSLFAEAGIEAPPATWDELLAAVEALKAAGITPISLGEGEKWPGHFYWTYLAIRNGGKAAFDSAYSGDGSFADPAFVKAGEQLQQLAALEPFQTDFLGATYPDADTLFANQQTAMQLMGHWEPNNVDDRSADPEAARADLAFFPFPMVEGGTGDPTDVLGGGDGFALGINAPDEAVDFVRFLTSPATQADWAAQGWAVPPAVTAAAEAVTDENIRPMMTLLEEANYFQLYYDQFLPPAVGGAVLDETQALIAGTQTPQGAAEAIEAVFAAETGS
jgi:raffinose/stachyose/melibiose transport system substrate-binding protein